MLDTGSGPAVLRLTGAQQRYDWGSRTAIPKFLGTPATTEPLAEVWFGAHPRGVCRLETGASLADAITALPDAALGPLVEKRFGRRLPYLLKIIAPAAPLSLQVHPSRDRAAARYDDEDQRGITLQDPRRNYHDKNHKPEMLLALTDFEALSGFRAPRRAAELLADLADPLATKLAAILATGTNGTGLRDAFAHLMRPETRPGPQAVQHFVQEVAKRLAAGQSPSLRADTIVGRLAERYPSDPGVVASILLNPVSLRRGEALYVPAGTVHAYLSGLGVEIMADSDNVLRAGLTSKHVDVPEMLSCVEAKAAPPVRIAPEHITAHTRVYFAPVDDFELSVTDTRNEACTIPGRGPRILLCTEGHLVASTAASGTLPLARGQAAFVPAAAGPVTVAGLGTVVQAGVP
ncbi:mannose-6-phosphate isomerase, class I [Buchananella hordeovulneris]|uniref:mannose-6-phosphate isomerase n=1 Tax=Buchananella hordeovulneris TaxID=52770 RepID=A0A1Q5PUU4_9ACTO|nr:mannose-6-phosphate isomerase, class I [Buchananella hordeovulneris]OKL51338.1 mannose-6-phosphate isomerase, class I [Buchananella hordeovulneris]